jgi:hypothetical protein
MKWHHILDKGPDKDSIIIQIFPPYDCYKGDFKKHYTMGMMQYKSYISHEEYLDYCAKSNYKPDFWWIYATDFPFPDKEI